MKAAVLGYKGFVGSYVAAKLQGHGIVICFGSSDTEDKRHGDHYDIVYDCRTFFSKLTKGTCVIDDGHTYDTLKYVLISSIEAEMDTTYGRAKLQQEEIMQARYKRLAIIRCGSIVGPGLRKGPVYDAMNWTSYLTNTSQIRLTPIDEIVERGWGWNGIMRTWSKDCITPVQLRTHFRTHADPGQIHEDYSKLQPETDYTCKEVLYGA